jgi:hypothetical protein
LPNVSGFAFKPTPDNIDMAARHITDFSVAGIRAVAAQRHRKEPLGVNPTFALRASALRVALPPSHVAIAAQRLPSERAR